jgi:hypothetical protein
MKFKIGDIVKSRISDKIFIVYNVEWNNICSKQTVFIVDFDENKNVEYASYFKLIHRENPSEEDYYEWLSGDRL